MSVNLRSRQGTLDAIFKCISIRDNEPLVSSISFEIPAERYLPRITLQLLDDKRYDIKMLRFLYRNIHNALYFHVTYSNGCEMVCSNTYDWNTKQHKLTTLCQKVA